MPGFPVVITDNAAPCVAVDSGAPVATVATNGLGVPITLVDAGAPPLVIEGQSLRRLMRPLPLLLTMLQTSISQVPRFRTSLMHSAERFRLRHDALPQGNNRP